jgi:hypothetical protein
MWHMRFTPAALMACGSSSSRSRCQTSRKPQQQVKRVHKHCRLFLGEGGGGVFKPTWSSGSSHMTMRAENSASVPNTYVRLLAGR